LKKKVGSTTEVALFIAVIVIVIINIKILFHFGFFIPFEGEVELVAPASSGVIC